MLVIGLGRFGGEIARALADAGTSVLGVDDDTNALDRLSADGIGVLYGDADDSNLPEMLPLYRADWGVSSVRTAYANTALIGALPAHGYRGRIAVSADFAADAATDAIRALRDHTV